MCSVSCHARAETVSYRKAFGFRVNSRVTFMSLIRLSMRRTTGGGITRSGNASSSALTDRSQNAKKSSTIPSRMRCATGRGKKHEYLRCSRCVLGVVVLQVGLSRATVCVPFDHLY